MKNDDADGTALFAQDYEWLQAAGYPAESRVNVWLWHLSHLKSGSPIPAFQAFIHAWQLGLTPPPWAYALIGKALTDYLRLEGPPSVDRLLGLVPGKGQDPPLKKHTAAVMEDALMVEIHQLRTQFKVRVDEACRMIEKRLEGNDENWPTIPAWANEIGLYRRWRESAVAKTLRRQPADRLPAWTTEEKGEFLRRYPRDAVPSSLRKQYLTVR